ncbi:signal peptidase I [Patescibacteria group bacterium]|nr:signal peptidase I [Patescibacteria group bacterium]
MAGKIIYWTIIIGVVLIAGLAASSAFRIPGSLKLYVVLTGSMEPAIQTGSLVAVRPEKTYRKGDIITFKSQNQPTQMLSHRIYEVRTTSPPTFITKGDANSAPDLPQVPQSQVAGKVILALPYAGYPVHFAKTREGLIILIIIPAVIIVYNELLTIRKEALLLIGERREQTVATRGKPGESSAGKKTTENTPVRRAAGKKGKRA